MRTPVRIFGLLLALLLSAPVLALNLNEAMSALPAAKAAGQLGEQPDGYLGVVSPVGNAQEIARQINEARRQEYQRLARENNIQLRDVESVAGKKALEKTPSGQYMKLNVVWMKRWSSDHQPQRNVGPERLHQPGIHSRPAVTPGQPRLTQNAFALLLEGLDPLTPLGAAAIQLLQPLGRLRAQHPHAQLPYPAFVGPGGAQGQGLLAQVVVDLRHQQLL